MKIKVHVYTLTCVLSSVIIAISYSAYSHDSKVIVQKVHAFCKKEKQDGMQIPLVRSLDRVSAMTGVSLATIKRITTAQKLSAKPVDSGDRIQEPDDFDKGVIRRIISNMYISKKTIPTLNTIKAALQENMNFDRSKSYLRKLLKRMGFVYKRCQPNRKVLIERQDVVLSRINYLRHIRRLREAGRNIIYTDETFVQSSHSVSKCWQDEKLGLKIPFSKGERMIVLHAGGMNGFVPGAALIFKAKSSGGDYHSEMNSANFTKWLEELLIPNLPPNSVLILDNAAYHNVQRDKRPTTATRKRDIQEWLDRHHVSYTPTMLKVELLHLCKLHKADPVYIVDDILSKHGHQALRLPPYHADLNPIELIWGNLKGFIGRNNMTFKLGNVKELIEEGLANITSNEWRRCMEHVEELESKYWDLDIAVDEMQESFVINLASYSESSDSDTDTASEAEC